MTLPEKLKLALENQMCRDALAFEFDLRDDQLDRRAERLPATVESSLAWAGLCDCDPNQAVQQVLLMYGGAA